MSGPSSPASSTPPPPVTPPGSSVASSLKAGSSRQADSGPINIASLVPSSGFDGPREETISHSPTSLDNMVSQASSSIAVKLSDSSSAASSSSLPTQNQQESTLYPGWRPLKDLDFKEAAEFNAPSLIGATLWRNIPPLAIITGANGSGKSQLLSYISYLERQATDKQSEQYKSLYRNAEYNRHAKGLKREKIDEMFSQPLDEVQRTTFIREVRYRLERPIQAKGPEAELISGDVELSIHIIQTAKVLYDKYGLDIASVKDDEIMNVFYSLNIRSPFQYDNAFSLLGIIFLQYKQQTKKMKSMYEQPENYNALSLFYKSSEYTHDTKLLDIPFEVYIKSPTNKKMLLEHFILKEIGTPPWEELNKLYSANKIELKVESRTDRLGSPLGGIKLMRGSISIPVSRLSTGEYFILEMFTWQYYVSGLSSTDNERALVEKIDVMLLDEPDRHFDPDLCKLFMSCVQHLTEKKKIQIIMTTHRTDTLAYAPEGSIFTIKRDDNGKASIIPTSRLNALFRLTPNLRDLTNLHIKVYVESHDDATVYERVYRQLLAFSAKERATGKMTLERKPRILSRRLQLSFYSVARAENGRGGGCAVVAQTIQRDIGALNHLDKAANTLSRIEGKIIYPFGLIDADKYLHPTGVDPFETRFNVEEYFNLESQIVYGNRYSLENYLYDPAILFSLLNKKEIRYWFTKDAALLNAALECEKLLGEKAEEYRIQEAFDKYFRNFLKLFLFNPHNQGDIKEHYYSIYHYLGLERSANNRSDKQTENFALPQNNIQDIITQLQYLQTLGLTPLTKENTNELAKIVTLSKKLSSLSAHIKNKIYDKLHDSSVGSSIDLIEKLIKDLGFIKDQSLEPEAKNNAIIDYLMRMHTKEILIHSPEGMPLYKLTYPGFFIYARGHNLESCMQSCIAEDGFKTWLIGEVAKSSKDLFLPLDLIEMIRDLNARVRAQANPVIKPHQLPSPPVTSSQAPSSKSKKSNKEKGTSVASSSSSMPTSADLGKAIHPFHEVINLASDYDERDLRDIFNVYFSKFITRFVSSTSMTEIEYNKMFGHLKLDRQGAPQTESSSPFVILERLRTDLANMVGQLLSVEEVVNRLMQAESRKIVIRSTDDTQSYTIQYPGFFIRANSVQLKEFVQDNEFEKWLIEGISNGSQLLTSPINLIDVIKTLDNVHRKRS